MKMYGASGVIAVCILFLGINRVEWSALWPGCYTYRVRAPGTVWMGWASESVWTLDKVSLTVPRN
jgi:hypothetical protein